MISAKLGNGWKIYTTGKMAYISLMFYHNPLQIATFWELVSFLLPVKLLEGFGVFEKKWIILDDGFQVERVKKVEKSASMISELGENV